MVTLELPSLLILYFPNPGEKKVNYCPPEPTPFRIRFSFIIFTVLTILQVRKILDYIILNLIYFFLLPKTIKVTLQHIIEIFLIRSRNILSPFFCLGHSPKFISFR